MFQQVCDTRLSMMHEDVSMRRKILSYPPCACVSASEISCQPLLKSSSNVEHLSNQYSSDFGCCQNSRYICHSQNSFAEALQEENAYWKPDSSIELKAMPPRLQPSDQSCNSSSSTEMCDEAESLSDLTELSLEELCAFPVMSTFDVYQLYEEHHKLSVLTCSPPQGPQVASDADSSTTSSKRRQKKRRKSNPPCLKMLKSNPIVSKQHQLLWQFLYAAASEPRFKMAIEMEDRLTGTFEIKNKQHFEEAWAIFKGSVKRVPYEYITRNMRYLYKPPHHFLSKVVGQQHKYKFLFQNIERCYGTDWKQVVAYAARNLLNDTSSNPRFSSNLPNFYCE